VIVLAQDEARALKHNYIGTEHLLLGLLREDEGLAARVLESLDITVEEVRAQVARIVGQGEEIATGQIPFTPRAKRVLEHALREAIALGHNYVGTEHVLLGLVADYDGVAAQILLDFDADAEKIRAEVLVLLSGGRASRAEPSFKPSAPVFSSELVDEINRVRTAKEEAIEAQEFEKAAGLRERERQLVAGARSLERAWTGEPDRAVSFGPVVPPPTRTGSSVRVGRVRDAGSPRLVLLGWSLFGVAAGIGLLAGRLIWG
jgi:ATP-dependent Clp protease ATP-binding subunit ClpA